MYRTCLLVSSVVLAPFPTSSAAAAPQQPVARNVELERSPPFPWTPAPGPGRSFLVSEGQQGGTDLNGDGDTTDRVLHILPQGAGPILSVGLAGDHHGPFFAGNTVALAVSEDSQGDTDLNGDADSLDTVLHVVDANTGTSINAGLAVFDGMLRLSESFAAIAVYENAQGITDLNGDGDALDRVLHSIELSTGVVTNFGLAVNNLQIHGDVIVGYVYEFQQGQDLNGDGDVQDTVPHVIDAALGSVHNFGFAWSGEAAISGGRVAFRLPETEAGVDLNGDGDLADVVVQLVDAAGGTTTNTGLATQSAVWLEGAYLAVAASEAQQGADLNQDGDQSDRVPQVIHVPSGSRTNTALAVSEISGLHGRLLTLHVSEFSQGIQDLNGDGDGFDSVLHVVNVTSGAATNVGLEVTESTPSSRTIGFLVREALQGGQDLNGDGDASDHVWHAYDASTGTTTNLGVAAFDPSALSIAQEDFLVCVASESNSGQQDLNGDGDLADDVVFLLRAGAPTQNLGVALTTSQTSKSMANSGRRVILPVFEASQGLKDLNGDGDFMDNVAHVLDVP